MYSILQYVSVFHALMGLVSAFFCVPWSPFSTAASCVQAPGVPRPKLFQFSAAASKSAKTGDWITVLQILKRFLQSLMEIAERSS